MYPGYEVTSGVRIFTYDYFTGKHTLFFFRNIFFSFRAYFDSHTETCVSEYYCVILYHTGYVSTVRAYLNHIKLGMLKLFMKLHL